jgi:hypothetical protein
MTDMRDIQETMVDVGKLDESVLEILQISDDCLVARYEDVDVEVEFDAASGRILLSTEIATPTPDKRLEIYETLLNYSLLWQETGGVRMALAGRGGPAIQMVDLETAGLRPDLLRTVLANLVDRTIIWRAFFASDGVAEVPLDALHPAFGIRV